jgi:hypothetical protein
MTQFLAALPGFFIKSFYLLYFESGLHRHQRSLQLWHGFQHFPSKVKIDGGDACFARATG